VRASAVAAAVGNGLVRLVRGRNHREFLGQCAMFPNVGVHDDCVDALSGAHNAVTIRGGTTTISVPRRRMELPDRSRQAINRGSGYVG
jgi:phage terminase large subunit-like protein